jgi:hypothetical protein
MEEHCGSALSYSAVFTFTVKHNPITVKHNPIIFQLAGYKFKIWLSSVVMFIFLASKIWISATILSTV